jgi:phage gp36-like protein
MTYAAQDDIEARYPGELAQAGPRDADNALDADAIELALAAADATIDRALRAIGWPMPFPVTVDPIPDWVIALAVDLALYLATPTVLASDAAFKDRLTRYQAALDTLNAIAAGRIIPSRPDGLTEDAVTGVYSTSNERLFGRGML